MSVCVLCAPCADKACVLIVDFDAKIEILLKMNSKLKDHASQHNQFHLDRLFVATDYLIYLIKS